MQSVRYFSLITLILTSNLVLTAPLTSSSSSSSTPSSPLFALTASNSGTSADSQLAEGVPWQAGDIIGFNVSVTAVHFAPVNFTIDASTNIAYVNGTQYSGNLPLCATYSTAQYTSPKPGQVGTCNPDNYDNPTSGLAPLICQASDTLTCTVAAGPQSFNTFYLSGDPNGRLDLFIGTEVPSSGYPVTLNVVPPTTG